MIITNLPTYQKKYSELIIVDALVSAFKATTDMEQIKRQAMIELIKKAESYEANAIINVKINYNITEYHRYCSIYGTAIKILED